MIQQINSDLYGAHNYGGAMAIIDGRKVRFGSQRGYAIYNLYLWNKPQMQKYTEQAEAAGKPLNEYVAGLIKQALAEAEEREANRSKWEPSPRYWINLQATVLSGDPGFYAEEERRWAGVPRLSVGDIVDFDGNLLRIVKAPNDNFALEAI